MSTEIIEKERPVKIEQTRKYRFNSETTNIIASSLVYLAKRNNKIIKVELIKLLLDSLGRFYSEDLINNYVRNNSINIQFAIYNFDDVKMLIHSDETINLAKFVLENPISSSNINSVAKKYIDGASKYKKKSKLIKRKMLKTIINKINSKTFNSYMLLNSKEVEPNLYTGNDNKCYASIIFKDTELISLLKDQLASLNIPYWVWYKLIQNPKVDNKQFIWIINELFINKWDKMNIFVIDEVYDTHALRHKISKAILLHIKCCQMKIVHEFVSILNNCKKGISTINGHSYYSLIRFHFLKCIENIKQYHHKLYFDADNVDSSLEKTANTIIIETLDDHVMEFQLDVYYVESSTLTFDEILIIVFLNKYTINSLSEYHTMRYLCDSFELLMTIVTISGKNIYTNCKPFMKHVLDNLIKKKIVNKFLKNNYAYLYTLNYNNDTTKTTILKYCSLKTKDIFSKINNIQAEEFITYAKLFRINLIYR
ncbi:uncharacterized protein LOC112594462 [Melanaphis sacchari]|uniref:uncharacterized protein LOC112594462 n=1 Tax=Melanaphis sacchari TaxID=742174 RepID=UPI000DC13EDF|nr:uncharacterized protein LOC112594462 [Melanaphis sacchari]